MTSQIFLLLGSCAFGYWLSFIIKYVLDSKKQKINKLERSDFDEGIHYNNQGGKTLQEMVNSKYDPENYFAGLGRNYHNE